MEFEQCRKVFDISPEPNSIRSWQKISSDLVGGHYIFPNGLHFIESVIPSEYPNMEYKVPKHWVRHTISPISTPFFITTFPVRGPNMGYRRVQQETYLTSTQVPGAGTYSLLPGTGTQAT